MCSLAQVSMRHFTSDRNAVLLYGTAVWTQNDPRIICKSTVPEESKKIHVCKHNWSLNFVLWFLVKDPDFLPAFDNFRHLHIWENGKTKWWKNNAHTSPKSKCDWIARWWYFMHVMDATFQTRVEVHHRTCHLRLQKFLLWAQRRVRRRFALRRNSKNIKLIDKPSLFQPVALYSTAG